MSLLFITTEFPPTVGGLGNYVYRLARSVNQQEKAIVLATGSPGYKKFDKSEDMEIVRAGREKSRYFKIIPLHRKAAKLVSKNKFRHVIAGSWNYAGIIALNLKRKTGIEYSLIVYGLEIRKYASHPVLAKKLASVLKGATTIFSISDYTAQLLRRIGVPNEKIRVIYGGADPLGSDELIETAEADRIKEEMGMKPGEKMILSVGRLIERKSFDFLLWSLPFVLQKTSKFKLIIIGDGPEKEKLKTIVKDLKIPDRVKIIHRVEMVDPYYRACDLFILLGRGPKYPDVEGLGLVLLEAAYHGKPVIAAESGGMPETFIDGKTGIIVPPANPKVTAVAIVKLLSNKKLATQMGKAGRERINKCFKWEHVAKSFLKALEQSKTQE